MKIYVKLLLLAAVVVSLVASCVNEGLQEPQDASVLKMIPSLEAQVAAVEASVEDLQNLQDALNAHDVLMDKTMADALGQHAADISKGGATLEEGTLASFKLQMKLGAAVGSVIAELDAETYETELKSSFDKLETGVCKWVGESFGTIYPVAVAEARVKASVAKFDARLDGQKLYVDALQSDIQAGLKTDGNPEELTSLAADVHEAAANSEKLVSDLVALSAEVEKEYEAAVKSVLADPAGFDGESLKEFNANAGIELAGVDNTLEGLASRVALCESKLADILERLGALETEIGDLEELLGMIQSVTFLSEFSEDKAVAYYTMNVNGTPDSEGRKPRTSSGTLDLKYVVRPASAAAALTTSSLWNSGLKVFGYYAEQMTKAAGDFFDFTITNVTADKTTGVATITVKNALSSAFFFKETGAKLALSLTTGATDLTSKFVEVVPKDQSGTVYIEELAISSTNLEIDSGQSKRLTATIFPENVTTGGVTWTSNNNDVVAVSSDGTITAKSVGEAVVTATSNSVDEWGNKLTAECKVEVNPSVRLSGPAYVEQGGYIEIRIESPDYISPDLIKWDITGIQYQNYATITRMENGSGSVYGRAMWFDTDEGAYKVIPVTCTIAGAMPLTLTHEIRVIAKQPKGIAIEELSYDQNKLPSVKKGKSFTINASLEPSGVDPSYFRILYMSSNAGVVKVHELTSGNMTATGFGTAFIDVKVSDSGTYNYFWPARDEFVRQVAVTVEPYYVETVILPPTMEMKLGDETRPAVEFVSDGGEGVQPEDMTLTWSSSNTDVVEVDPETGRLTAKSEGSAVITATTAGELSVPEGSAHKSASCTVVVRSATAADPKVGDFYYYDGSWSTELEAGKTVIGVVFSLENATNYDAVLRTDHPTCYHGLVVGLVEYKDAPNTIPSSFPKNSAFTGTKPFVKTEPHGYGMTQAFNTYRENNDDDGLVELWSYDSTVGVPGKQESSYPSPASKWYIPSFFELAQIRTNINDVNASLTKANGNVVQNDAEYWMSSFLEYSDGGYNYLAPYSMAKGDFGTDYGYSGTCNTEHPVRVVLAF